MVLSIGIDAVEINRFECWYYDYSLTQLKKIFSSQEIEYCLSHPLKHAERFAVRFAAKEAFYKALCSAELLKAPYYFLSLARGVEVEYNHTHYVSYPVLRLNQHLPLPIRQSLLDVHIALSLSHTKTIATAFITFSYK